MDVVYVLGTGSRWKDNEIRYSLRSIGKYLKGIDYVFVVGECPSFLKNVHHIPCKDGPIKERNIMQKISAACAESCLSEQFLFINDDHFLLKPTKSEGLPYYSKGTLKDSVNKRRNDTYRNSMQNTYNELYRQGLPSFHYDIHCPIVYNKRLFPEVMECYNWDIPYGYVIKSLYSNTLKLKPVMLQDCKISKQLSPGQLRDKIQNRWIFSIGDGSLGTNLNALMEELYPDKSRWEK